MSEDEDVSVEIQMNDEIEEQNDCHPDTVEVDLIAGETRLESEIADEVDVEVEIPAEELINVEVCAPVVEVEIEVPLNEPVLDADIVVEDVVVAPTGEGDGNVGEKDGNVGEGGGNVDEKPKNSGICCLVCAIIFGV